MKNVVLSIAFLIFNQNIIKACDCITIRGFCEVINYSKNNPNFCIAKVKILSSHYHGIKVKVLNTIYNVPLNDTVTIWGDNGLLCRTPLSFGGTQPFNLGDTLIVAMEQTDLLGNIIPIGGQAYEDNLDYMLPGCGKYYLKYSNQMVSGGYTNYYSQDTLTYSNFMTQINNCLTLPLGIKPNVAEMNELLFPNPVNEILNFKQKNFDRLLIYNSVGQLILEENIKGKSNISLTHLAKGVYYVKLSNTNKTPISTFKIYKE